MKLIKLLITVFFLLVSFWLSILIFKRNFTQHELEFAVDNHIENNFMILIVSTILSAVGVFLLGLLSLFVNFVFVKLIYTDEINKQAFNLLKFRRFNKKK